MKQLKQLKGICPCLFGDDATKKLMGIPPANSDSDSEKPDSSMGDKARGWLEMASAPVKAFHDRRQQDVARTERADGLKAGSSMKLLSKEGNTAVRLTLSADGALVTWQSLEMTGGMPKLSGVLALSAVREVAPVLQSGFLRTGGPVPRQWQLLADDQTVKFEAESEEEKDRWMSTVEELRHHEADAKAERKIGYTTRRKMGLEEGRREAERRKAEVAAACNAQPAAMCSCAPRATLGAQPAMLRVRPATAGA